MTLALQQFFVSERHSPVPSLLVYDQPSQVYFPRSRRRSEKDGEPILNDEDIEAVRRVFAAMAKVVDNTKGKLQVVVLDHAAEDVWGDIAGINKVEEWRDGQKLVPEDWPLAGSS